MREALGQEEPDEEELAALDGSVVRDVVGQVRARLLGRRRAYRKQINAEPDQEVRLPDALFTTRAELAVGHDDESLDPGDGLEELEEEWAEEERD